MSKLDPVVEKVRESLSKNTTSILVGDIKEFVYAFFSKAPTEFLRISSAESLCQIIDESLALALPLVKALEESGLESDNFDLVRTTVSSTHGTTHIVVVVPDRPFIVNTISECIEEVNLNPVTFLHPILKIGQQRISCSYISFSGESIEQAQKAALPLAQSLTDLLKITSDHPAMLLNISKISEKLLLSIEKNSETQKEAFEFLHWLMDGNFIFLGLREQSHSGNASCLLGMFRTSRDYLQNLLNEVALDIKALTQQEMRLSVTRLRTKSPIHRFSPIVNITIQINTYENSTRHFFSIIGLLSSKARSQESSGVPIIRRKLQQLLELEELVFNSHDYKYVTDIIDTMPKDDAFRLDVPALREIVHTILEMRNRNEIRVTYRISEAQRSASVLIVMPRDRFNSQIRQRIQQRIEEIFNAERGASEYNLNYSNKPLIRFYFYVPLKTDSYPAIDIAHLEMEIAEIARSWTDNYQKRLIDHFNEEQTVPLWKKYQAAFPNDYQALYNIHDALFDTIQCEQLCESSKSLHAAMLPKADQSSDTHTICIYSKAEQVTISRALPILDNLGLDVINENSSLLAPQGYTIFVHRFLIKIRSEAPLQNPTTFEERLTHAIVEIFTGLAESDSLNSLIINSSIPLRAVALFRVYCALLWQITNFASRQAIFDSLSSYPEISQRLWNMFSVRFDPELQFNMAERHQHYQRELNNFKDNLRSVTDITKDRILRGISSLLSASIRTSYYQGGERISIKFSSREVDLMPNPKPLYEIFVRSSLTEGVHLRNGPVSRGGIRWSDRVEDYRSEVLGLMATQTMKNVLIVPDGAKGGFIVRQLPKLVADVPAAVRAAYSDFIRGILSISDNRAGEQIIRPAHVICWDETDPYVVVAADKGTASFSDTANQIAVDEYKFWLDDAFASGGSLGYDHKKYAITAKGAWESTRRHFSDCGIDFTTHEFTCVGIGDMSGDVFGNGALLSSTMKLIAAFDHRHIFIDPNPNPKISFEERKRLFALARSQWSDYQKELISPGGAVFGRFEKEITPSEEIRNALGIDIHVNSVMSGEELISHILCAPVDLLFNGGIGTYVKSSSQSNADVNDGTNDRVRIDANQLRAKIVVEGGNLGFTQKARVEFAENGGRINTDAIDNSGGVDLSDHEVNLKILFGQLMAEHKITRAERDLVMLDIAAQVVDLVLLDNRYHALFLSIAVSRSRKNISYFHSFIHRMVKLGYVTRHRDSLPDDDALNERVAKKLGLVRPELSVCLAAAKRWMKTCLLETEIPKHPLLKQKLLEYFPEKLHEKYRNSILNHPLSDNIIATQVTNYLVNTTGVTFLHRICLQYSVSPRIVLNCTIAADIILGGEQIQKQLWKLDKPHLSDFFINCWTENSGAIRQATTWLVRNHDSTLSLDELVDLYQVRFQTLVEHADDIFEPNDATNYQEYRERLIAGGLKPETARHIALYPDTLRIFEMLWTSRESRQSIPVVASVYGRIVEKMQLGKILKMETAIDTSSKWESELLSHSYDEIRHGISLLAVKLLENGLFESDKISRCLEESANFEQLNATLIELEGSVPSVTAIAVITRQLASFKPNLKVTT
jgi:glutamate dehydrogenase